MRLSALPVQPKEGRIALVAICVSVNLYWPTGLRREFKRQVPLVRRDRARGSSAIPSARAGFELCGLGGALAQDDGRVRRTERRELGVARERRRRALGGNSQDSYPYCDRHLAGRRQDSHSANRGTKYIISAVYLSSRPARFSEHPK